MSILGLFSDTEVAPCVALTPILHLSDVESPSPLFRVATAGRERTQRDVPSSSSSSSSSSHSPILHQQLSILQQVGDGVMGGKRTFLGGGVI